MSNPREKSGSGYATRRPVARSRKGMWIRLSLFLVVLGLLGAGYVYTLRAGFFDVVKVESGAYRFTNQEELDNILGSYLGRNIWTLSESQVADSMATLPWVRDLRVAKSLPGSIEVDFREWRPLLALAPTGADAAPLVMVEDGRILEYPDHLPVAALPVLVGVNCLPDSLDGQLRLDPHWAPQVMSLLEAMASTALETAGPVDFLVARPEGFAIVLQEGLGQLLVGHEEFVDRLARYMAARDHLEPGLKMDLRFGDQIICSRL